MSANTILTSIVTGGTNSHATTAEEANVIATDFVTQGVVGNIVVNAGSGGSGSFCVNADGTPDMGVTVKAGQAYISAAPSGQNTQVLRARAAADYTAYTINANASGSTKYDWIYLKVDPTNANVPASDASNVTSIYTSRSSSNTADSGTPPTYGVLLAIVTVANGASSITNSNITDKRTTATINSAAGSLTATQLSTGQDAIVQAAGADTNVNLKLAPKGTGVITIGENGSSTSQISATGADTNIDLRLAPKGTGNVKRGTTGGAIDWWEELGRTTLAVAGDTITVNSLPARKYLKVIATFQAASGTVHSYFQLNNDTGTNYSYAYSISNGANTTAVTQGGIVNMGNSVTLSSGDVGCTEATIVNVATYSKSSFGRTTFQSSTSAGFAPVWIDFAGEWANTAAQISRFDLINDGTGDFAIGSEVIILGHN